MDFRKRLKMRQTTAIVYIMIGLVFLALSWWMKHDFLSSLGLVFVVMGLARLRQYRRITSSEENLKQREVVETDERNVMLWTKARSLAFSYSLMVLCIATIIMQLLGHSEVTKLLGIGIYCFITIYWLCYWYVKKQY